MRHLSIAENGNVLIEDTDEKVVCLWSREEFEDQFQISLPADLIKLNCEPDRNLFLVAYGTLDNVTDLKGDPSQDGVMDFLNTSLDTFMVTARERVEDDKIVEKEIAKVRKDIIQQLKTDGKIKQDYI